MDVRSARTNPVPLAAPVFKAAKVGVASGSVMLSWLRLQGAKTFAIEHTADLTGETGWTNGADFTRTKGMVAVLNPGTRYLFRIAGVNPLGKGPWSQTVKQFAAL